MGLDITGLGAAAELAGSLIDRFFPNKTEQEKQQMAAALTIMQGQLAINQTEAANPNWFVSGWRPFIGWVCGSACAWNWVGISIANFLLTLFHNQIILKPASLEEMFPILASMLGLAGYRTFEKVKDVAAK